MLRFVPALLLLAWPAVASTPVTLQVGSGQQYSSIQSAINAAHDGDTIVVHAGNYNEQLIVELAGVNTLTIEGYPGDSVSVICPNDKVNGIIAQTMNLRLKNLTLVSPDHQSPAGQGINFLSSTGTGTQTYSLLMCGVTEVGHNDTGSTAFACGPSDTDVLQVAGKYVSMSAFTIDVGGKCAFGGWDDPLDLCSGW